MKSRALALISLFVLGACDGVNAPTDSGQPDAGSTDAGSSDAGVPGDAGMDGAVEPECMDECAEGSRSCDGTELYRVCGQYDLDPCLEPSPPIACAAGYACTGSSCAPPCRDECPVGGSLCMDEATLLSCGNFDVDACREPGAGVTCGATERCEAGSCVDETAPCTDECAAGTTACFGDAVRTCGEHDSDSCLDLGPPAACGPGELCAAGACGPYCVDDCTAGAIQCVGDGTQVCGDFDADPCQDWGPISACPAGESCTAGVCSTTCDDECDNTGGPVCTADGRGVGTCGMFDSDSCRDVSSAIYCPLGFSCRSGVCVASCTNDCAPTDAPRCAGDGTSVQTCGNYDADVCTEWGGDAACPGGADCNAGVCDTPCTDECTTSGATECVSGSSATRTCGQYDLDACREWSSSSPCAAWEACASGACALGPTPATLVINELLYDSVGADADPGNASFVELWGPPGASLDGWSLVGVDGNTGTDYNALALDGQQIGPDGWFVIAHPSAAAPYLAASDLTSATVDYQNGPDSVQLRWHERVVDAVGYGTFGASTFAGEGTAAPGVAPGRSLTRDVSHTDTNNNADDFRAATIPTPRMADPGCTDECATTGATQCSGAQIQTCGNHDADACREWSAPAACPTAGHVCAAGTGTCGAPSCTDECSTAGARRCSGIQIQTCTATYDADPCLEWGAPAGCPGAGEQCSGAGVCAIPCTDDCTSGARRCSATQLQVCGNHDADTCSEWSVATACPGSGEVCTGAGVCSVPCTDECTTAGATRCSGTQVQTCGSFDADACREWSTATSCPAGQLCSGTACLDMNAPEVVLIAPMGSIQTTQGNMHRMVVDATAAPGRSITAVRYYADGMLVGMTTSAPHELVYVVPAAAMTGSSIALQASAVDNAASVGWSMFASLDVRNDAPVASFTATITNTSTATVDASGSSDTETPAAMLQVCWDWNNDGTCETPFSTTKIATHDFGASGTFTIGMRVRDSVGQISTTTRTVTFTDIQYVGGVTLTSTLWYGTVIVTGDIAVGAGQTLTIAPGTDVLFVRADVDPPAGVGDYTLTVNGQLVVNGTASEPVVISGQDAAGHVRGAWDRILITGSSPSTITHAIIEYADVGLEVRNGSTLTNVMVRSTRSECILLSNADSASLTDVTTTSCGTNGVTVLNGSSGVTMTRHTSTANGADGIAISATSTVTASAGTFSTNMGNGGSIGAGSSLNLTDAIVETNGQMGLLFTGTAQGAVRHNQIRTNGREGVGLRSDAAGDPSPVVTANNIYSNASAGSSTTSTVSTSSTLTASQTYSTTSATTSGAYTAPAGHTIHRVNISYDESDSSIPGSYINGYLIDGTSGATLRTFDRDFSGWVYLPTGVTSVRVRVWDSGYSGTLDTIIGSQVEVIGAAGAADVTSITATGTADLRYNYLGTFPNVLSRVSMSRNTALNLQGFVGVLYDGSWDPGPYKAGALTTQSWSGTIYVTGDVSIAAGQTVTVAAGTQVRFVDHDQNGDGAGDFTITATGPLNMAGTSGSPVLVSGHGTYTGDAFQSVVLAGAAANASTFSWVNLDSGVNGITITGSSALSDVVVTGGAGDGITIRGSTGARLTDVRVVSAGDDGVLLDNGDGATLTRVTSEMNAGDGIVAINGSTTLTLSRAMSRMNGGDGLSVAGGSGGSITDSTFRDNDGHGVRVTDSSPTIDYNLLTYNGGAGMWIEGTGSTSAQYNIIKFNDDAGYLVWTNSAGSPAPTLQYSNVYGNAIAGTSRTSNVSTSSPLTASQTYSTTSSTTSGAYTAPAGRTIRRVQISYDESDSSIPGSYINAYLVNASTGATLRTFDRDYSGWVYLPAGVTSVQVRVWDSGYSGTLDTITGSQVELVSFSTADHYELASTTDANTSMARFNYWTSTIADVPMKIYQSRAGSVDYTGFTGLEYPSGPVTQIGPRP